MIKNLKICGISDPKTLNYILNHPFPPKFIGFITKVDLINFEDEILKITYKDYYFSNVIARSSKTMLNCNNSKLEVKRTGTEG